MSHHLKYETTILQLPTYYFTIQDMVKQLLLIKSDFIIIRRKKLQK